MPRLTETTQTIIVLSYSLRSLSLFVRLHSSAVNVRAKLFENFERNKFWKNHPLVIRKLFVFPAHDSRSLLQSAWWCTRVTSLDLLTHLGPHKRHTLQYCVRSHTYEPSCIRMHTFVTWRDRLAKLIASRENCILSVYTGCVSFHDTNEMILLKILYCKNKSRRNNIFLFFFFCLRLCFREDGIWKFVSSILLNLVCREFRIFVFLFYVCISEKWLNIVLELNLW